MNYQEEIKRQNEKYKQEQSMQQNNAIREAVPAGGLYGDSVATQKEMPVPTEIARLEDRLRSLFNRIHNLEERLHPVLKELQPAANRVQHDCSGSSQLAGSLYVMAVMVEDMMHTVNTLAERVEL